MNNRKTRVPYEAPECEIIQLASEDILEVSNWSEEDPL